MMALLLMPQSLTYVTAFSNISTQYYYDMLIRARSLTSQSHSLTCGSTA